MRLTLGAAAVVLLAGCDSCESSRPAPRQDDVPLRVGPHRYSNADLELRGKIIKLKYPESADDRLGPYAQLVEGALEVEVLAAIGHSITEAAIDAELKRIDGDTKDPAGLAELKRLCGGEHTTAYRRIAILPDFANRVLFFEVYPKDESLHQAGRDAHEFFYEKAKAVPVRIADAALREEFRKQVSWARDLRWEN